MIYLIRTIENRAGGSTEQRDTEYSGDAITIGRATDQDIQLMDPEIGLHHARIKLLGGGIAHIKSLSSVHALLVSQDLSSIHPLLVSEKAVRESALNVGDSVQLGASNIKVIDAPAGFDFALTLERGEIEDVDKLATSQFVTSLDQTSLFKRGWAWLFFVSILTLFLIIPVSGIFNDDLQDILRSTPLPDDSVWNPGHLIPAHRAIEANCDNCHIDPFKVVQNGQCLQCHENVRQHTNSETEMEFLDQAMCSTCHMQHKEPSVAVTANEKLCINCHESLSSRVSETDLADASDFGKNHPDFKLSLLSPENEGGDVEWKTVRIAHSSQSTEKSNLNFPHDKHLSFDGVESPGGTQWLECNSCHTLDDQGLLMKPITMKDACRRCHTLSFDQTNPDRQVPHGLPAQVILSLEEYYARLYLENTLDESEVSSTMVRKQLRQQQDIGREFDQSERFKILALARASAEKTATHLFEESGCKLCHTISINENAEDLLSKWSVAPVRVISRWLPNHQFNHYEHRTEDCTTCHNAADSQNSTDILIPEISVCRDCHNNGDGRLDTTCAACHSFHASKTSNIPVWH